MKTHAIEFTRFHLPNGRQTTETTKVGDKEFAAYKAIRAAGFRMTIETLSTGQISFAIEHPTHGDFDVDVCANGPDVPRRISKMLLRFKPTEAKRWIEEKENAE